MTYTIAQAAQRCGLTPHTMRYYDKEGLLPFVERSPSGARQFKESDFEWLHTINCLKDTGMPIKKIKEFIDACIEGDDTIEWRLEFMRAHKREVQRQMDALEKNMETIDHKLRYYEAAVQSSVPK